jgi:hypothetical protein
MYSVFSHVYPIRASGVQELPLLLDYSPTRRLDGLNMCLDHSRWARFCEMTWFADERRRVMAHECY